MSETVRKGGEFILPERALKRLGVVPGMDVDIIDGAEGEIVLRKADTSKLDAALEKWSGFLENGPTTDEIMEISRGEV